MLPVEKHISLENQSAILLEDWQLLSSSPQAYTDPHSVAEASSWLPAQVPGTIASNNIPLDDYDSRDWWYQCRFQHPGNAHTRLSFAGLATIAEVWLNGQLLLCTHNMFRHYHIDIGAYLQNSNHLILVFRALQHALQNKRPRPRWKTNLIEHQQLRWQRTTLLGHMPAWCPPFKAVGPWRMVSLQCAVPFHLDRCQLQPSVQDGRARICLYAELRVTDQTISPLAELHINGQRLLLETHIENQQLRVSGEHTLNNVPLWWPHTHGEPALLKYALVLRIADDLYCVQNGKIGFKQVAFEEATDFALRLNGRDIFCRGACWTCEDIKTLQTDPQQLRRSLTLAQQAGINMLRIGGTMLYESDRFYSLCDELGIMVWQDFMFANMDYPIEDADFAANVGEEIKQQLTRLSAHACIVVYCGNSEVEQQAAMWGMPAEIYRNALFYEYLPQTCAQLHAGIPYLPSSPYFGDLPFHIATGVSHYFGVGAYKRRLDDASIARVKFTSECLGLSNLPDDDCLSADFGSATPQTHQPVWKQGIPRDHGAGWDFEDIRDHYLKELFGLDAQHLRYSDNSRYIALSQIVSGEVMQYVFSQWRSGHCHGALLWFFKDLQAGAGWGILDHCNRPKPVYYYLKRLWARQTLFITDRQLDGLHLCICNESAEVLRGRITLRLLQHGKIEITAATRELEVAAFGNTTLSADALLGRFYDTNYAYRFGPSKHDTVVASLEDTQGGLLADTFYFPNGLNLPVQTQAELQHTLIPDGEDLLLRLQSNCLLQAVQLYTPGYIPNDNYFHLAPGSVKTIRLYSAADHKPEAFKGRLRALNLIDTQILKL